MERMVNYILLKFGYKVVRYNNSAHDACERCREFTNDFYSWKYNGKEFLLCTKCNDMLDKQFLDFLTPPKTSKKEGGVLYLKDKNG